ncbi:helix-turn-helix domain-containing protein [Streptomyces sp. NA04227]|uniref:helix-turn-helix domain-containing protein n=1 Tax=Streptomyces sp. NA04227 TaxID=2742136 RepID=UPI001590CF6A|nr:helix-turn-helix domain-containing protein [Streptomyces sp. NA04227]QKW08054.1 helix-turn-helix domain-containing protein [Streptomyces sp. NA04227]
MADPITDADREQVRRLHAAGKSRNAIAREIGRSSSTVSKIGRELGLRFEGGARVAPATEARRQDLAAVRTELQQRLYARASANLARVEANDYTRTELLPNGRVVRVTSHEPPAQDERHHSQAVASYLASAQRLAEVDAGSSSGAVRSMLTDLAAGIREAFADEEQETDTGG